MTDCKHTNCPNHEDCHSDNPDTSKGCVPDKPITEFKHHECFSHILKVEDHFMFADTFQAGFGSTPRKSSMCAYGTILDYGNFDKAWEKIKDDYSPDCWKEMCEYWLFQHYLSPIPVIFVSCIYRKLGLKLDIDEAKKRVSANASY